MQFFLYLGPYIIKGLVLKSFVGLLRTRHSMAAVDVAKSNAICFAQGRTFGLTVGICLTLSLTKSVPQFLVVGLVGESRKIVADQLRRGREILLPHVVVDV
jgi:hypothetical protein